ncbi:MAG: glutamate racemase [Chloroflexota bacterium]
MSDPRPIGILDSGVGGLSVLREIARQLPYEDVLYVADQAHIPYGPRPLGDIRALTLGIVRLLRAQGAKVIVIACNTASAAALYTVRAAFPDLPIVGMEPAVKPAAERSRARRVAVLATPATFQGELFASLIERFAQDVEVLPQACPGLVEQVEAGDLDGPQTQALLRTYLSPLLAAGADTLVLGCTHYPFLLPAIAQIAGPQVEVIDPSPAVARQTGRVLAASGLENTPGRQASYTFCTTGDVPTFRALVKRLIDLPGTFVGLIWQEGGELAMLSGGRGDTSPPP